MFQPTLIPYLFFTGNCNEAMEFYKSVFGGELNIIPNPDRGGVMHAALTGGITLFGSDGTRTEAYPAGSISLCLDSADLEEMTSLFEKLSQGGSSAEAIHTESWGASFGSLTDKYGIDWIFNVPMKG